MNFFGSYFTWLVVLFGFLFVVTAYRWDWLIIGATPIEVLQILLTGLTAVTAVIAVIFAYKVGQRQNEINVQALGLQDFAEIFFMPQQVICKEADPDKQLIGWNLLIKNASAYPVYICKYILNGKTNEVGGSAVPNRSDEWYSVSIPEGIEKLSVVVEFEDYRGKKYKTEGRGKFDGKSWSIKSARRVELN